MSKSHRNPESIPELLPKPDIIEYERRILLEFVRRYGVEALVNLLKELCSQANSSKPRPRSPKGSR
jgi:hypothetical protein